MKPIRVGIIGVGPRGVTVLERIVANERSHPSGEMEIYLFDPQEPGVGCHDPAQSEYLLVNTVAGQITQFSDPSVRDAGPIMEGPSFYQWLAAERDKKVFLGQNAAPISPDAYYSRASFGRYLHWVYHYLCGLAPSHVKIQFVKTSVTHAELDSSNAWFLETPAGGFLLDYLFLTTGHSKPKTSTAKTARCEGARLLETTVVDDPYPVDQKLSHIGPHTTVAIEGMGLTTFDVLADLTVGRGGRFEKDPATGELRYLASGREPHIVAFSRSGLPLTARAVNQKGVSIQYKARFLFAHSLRELRAQRKLDFVADVMPLLLADMQYAYCEAYLKEKHDALAAMLFCNQFVCAGAVQRQALIEQYIPKADRFSLDKLMSPVPAAALESRDAYSIWMDSYLREDLANARKGNIDGPIKAASDVLRDLRDTLRAAIDHGGLTEASHRWLLSEFVPVMNRIAVGPPASRIAEMLALMKAGVLEADWGPGASCEASAEGGLHRMVSSRWPGQTAEVHALIKARIAMPNPKEDVSVLMQRLLDAGHVRPFFNGNFHPGGIEIDHNFNWVSRHGAPVRNAWALGIPTEGVKFYTFVVPRPGVNSTALVDAGRAVGTMLSMITGRTPALHTQPASLPTEEYASAFASLYGAL